MHWKILKLQNLFSLLMILTQVGCSSYHPKPLPKEPNFNEVINNICNDCLVYTSDNELRFKDNISLAEFEKIVLTNNPDLKSLRKALKLSQAEVFAAGLLPDPQIGWSRDYSSFYQPGISPSYNIGINYDLNTIIGYYSKQEVANKEMEKVYLSVLWQEWQMLSKLRLLMTQRFYLVQQKYWLNQSYQMMKGIYKKKNTALLKHNFTFMVFNSLLEKIQSFASNIKSLKLQIKQLDHEINNLLGLPSNTVIPNITVDLPNEQDLITSDDQIAQMLNLRPDLQALASGYSAQDEKLREAILLQFPAVNLGIHKVRDTTSVFTKGFSLTISLPIFNRNQGNIAVAEATREKLYQEYQNRLNAAKNQITQVIEEFKLLKEQFKIAQLNLVELQKSSINIEKTFNQNNLNLDHYINFKTSLIQQDIEKLKVKQLLAEHLIIFQTLTTFNLR